MCWLFAQPVETSTTTTTGGGVWRTDALITANIILPVWTQQTEGMEIKQ